MGKRSVVYFARIGTCVKIGCATNLRGRMAQLCIPLSAVVGTLPGGHDLEHDLHARFGASRIDGSEWFVITPEIEELFATLTPPEWAPKKSPAAKPVADVPWRLLYDVTEAAILLGVSEGTVLQLISEHKLPFVRLGRAVRIERQHLVHLRKAGRRMRSNAGGGPWHPVRHNRKEHPMGKLPTPGPEAVQHAVRTVPCPLKLCAAAAAEPCGPDGSHVARWLAALKAGVITRAELTEAIRALVVVDALQVIGDAA